MTKRRTPTPTTGPSLKDMLAELSAANQRAIEAEAKAEAAEKAKADAIASKVEAQKNYTAIHEEMEQLHGLIDALPGALPRESQCGDYEWQKRKNSAMTRLASWLATR